MKKKHLAQSVLHTIQEQNITPRPRWHYIVKDGVFWGVFFLSILLGAGGGAVVLYAILDTDFDLITYVPTSQLTSFLRLLPALWVLLFGFFVWAAVWGAQHTKKGYRHSIVWLVGTNMLLSLLLGGGLYAAGGGEVLERVFAEHVPFYRSIQERRKEIWRRAGGGFLVGKILDMEEENMLILEDIKNNVWRVDYSRARVHPELTLENGTQIRMIGEKDKEDFLFRARAIVPWSGGRPLEGFRYNRRPPDMPPRPGDRRGRGHRAGGVPPTREGERPEQPPRIFLRDRL